MGCGRRVASEKCSRNQRLSVFPATFGADNPHKPPRADSLTQEELAPRQGEIAFPPRFPAFERPRQPGQRAVQSFPPRLMATAADRLHDTAHQPAAKVQGQALQHFRIEGDTPLLADLEKHHTSLRRRAFMTDAHKVCIGPAGMAHTGKAQPRPLEARIDV